MNYEVDDFCALRSALHSMCERLAAGGVPEDVLFETRVVADELLSNALRYGGGAARLRAAIEGDEIRIAVKSANGYRPPAKSTLSAVTEESGRGLYLVDAFGTREYDEADGVRVVILIRR